VSCWGKLEVTLDHAFRIEPWMVPHCAQRATRQETKRLYRAWRASIISKQNSKAAKGPAPGRPLRITRELALLLIHFIVTIFRLFGPGGARSSVVESLLIKHQLLILTSVAQSAYCRCRRLSQTATSRINCLTLAALLCQRNALIHRVSSETQHTLKQQHGALASTGDQSGAH